MIFVVDIGELVMRANNTPARRCILMSDSDISSDNLELTGADVDGLEADDVISRASVLIAPNANFIAFSDGVFKKK